MKLLQIVYITSNSLQAKVHLNLCEIEETLGSNQYLEHLKISTRGTPTTEKGNTDTLVRHSKRTGGLHNRVGSNTQQGVHLRRSERFLHKIHTVYTSILQME